MTCATINLSRIKANYSLLSKRNFVIPVLKSDAYGHGLCEVSDACFSEGARLFAVIDATEAARLLSYQPRAEALILSGDTPSHLYLPRTILSLASAEAVARIPRGARVHIALNAGMNRAGFSLHPADFDRTLSFLRGLLCSPHLTVTGVYTHFPVPPTDPRFSKMKLRFLNAAEELRRLSPDLLFHAAATPALGTELFPPAFSYTAVRTGLALYGYGTGGVHPAMTLSAPVIGRFLVRAGESIGYGADYVTKQDTETALLACGYADGLPRLHRGICLYRDRRFPVLGRVSMNLTVIGGEGLPRPGEHVTLFGDGYTADAMAEDTDRITYELLLAGRTARRSYIYDK